MSDQNHDKKRQGGRARDDRAADFAAQMARAEFGRHYVDNSRIEQVVEGGEVIFRHRKRGD